MWECVAAVVAAANVNYAAAGVASTPSPKRKEPEPAKTYREEHPYGSSIGKTLDPCSPFPPSSMDNVMLNIALNS